MKVFQLMDFHITMTTKQQKSILNVGVFDAGPCKMQVKESHNLAANVYSSKFEHQIYKQIDIEL